MAKIIAFYLPQFHEIPENNEWWGQGFTEWTNLNNWKPLFDGHTIYTPHNSIGQYDIIKYKNIRKRQADLAKSNGIDGFCYYHYWSCGRQLLEKPLELMLEDGEPNIPFMLSWANEGWTRKWEGKGDINLWKQEYGDKQEWEQHFLYLLKFFKHPNYIKLDNKPVFSVYRIAVMEQYEERIKYYKERAIQEGFSGIHFLITNTIIPKETTYDNIKTVVDGMIEFEPPNMIRESIKNPLLKNSTEIPIRDKKLYWDLIENNKVDYPFPYYRGTFVHWDNSPRMKNDSFFLFSNEKISTFKNHIKNMVNKSNQENLPFLFINAWNEWGEGAVLEPSKQEGYNYLESIREANTDKKITYRDIDGWFDFQEVYKFIVNNSKNNSHFVEVGSWLGKSSAYMAECIRDSGKNIVFHCIDIWEYDKSDPDYHFHINNLPKDVYQCFLDNIKKTGALKYISPLKLTSKIAADLFDDNSLDFVFIDANHKYEFVKEDIELWYPKIKHNGYIGGHDYLSNHDGVKKAVEEKFGNKIEVIGTSWLIKKQDNIN